MAPLATRPALTSRPMNAKYLKKRPARGRFKAPPPWLDADVRWPASWAPSFGCHLPSTAKFSGGDKTLSVNYSRWRKKAGARGRPRGHAAGGRGLGSKKHHP